MSYWLRIVIAFDQFVQALLREGTPGITISSRAGTAAAHGHRWGCWLCWLLDRAWGFGGLGHCESAIRHDIERAQAVIYELRGDPVVTRWLIAQDNKPK